MQQNSGKKKPEFCLLIYNLFVQVLNMERGLFYL